MKKLPVGIPIALTFILTGASILVAFPKDTIRHWQLFNVCFWTTIVTCLTPFAIHWPDWTQSTREQLADVAKPLITAFVVAILPVQMAVILFAPHYPKLQYANYIPGFTVLHVLLGAIHGGLAFLISKRLLRCITEYTYEQQDGFEQDS
jgi:hypothetical protein